MDKRSQGARNRLLGRWGEALVAEYLRHKGWRILGTGYRCRFGEIDLIASDGKFIAFTEVKLRKDARHGTAAEAVDPRKQARVQTTAKLYLTQNPTHLQSRFDVAEVYAPQGTETIAPRIVYIENAF